MKKLGFLFFALFAIISCTTVKQHNERLKTTISPSLLQKDVDYTYRKLKKLHPNLYWYISKEDLDRKFTELKKELTQPLTPYQFYEKLQPVVSLVREGHLRVSLPEPRFTKEELKKLEKQKGLFSRMNYVIENNRIFVKDNADKFGGLLVGTEILEINDIPISQYLTKYNTFVNGDGYNTTFHKYSLAKRWANFFTIEKGILDSVKIKTAYKNEIKTQYISRETRTKAKIKEEKEEVKTIFKTEQNKVKDYNIVTKDFNRKLSYINKDSSIAYMKIAKFSGTLSAKFYKQSFKSIKKAKSQYLILDVRDNLGGSLSEISNLYSYLALSEFKFTDDIEVNGLAPLYSADYYSEFPGITKAFAFIAYPAYFIGSTFSVKSKNHKYYLRNNNLFTPSQPKEDAFKGKIYLLINGSSFSASSIIASKLKFDQRATLVGEETGGANDGTVAGRYATIKLPNSKLDFPIGIMLIKPHIEFTNTQKGVTPNQIVDYSLFDVLSKKDKALDWIKEDIYRKKVQNQTNLSK